MKSNGHDVKLEQRENGDTKKESENSDNKKRWRHFYYTSPKSFFFYFLLCGALSENRSALPQRGLTSGCRTQYPTAIGNMEETLSHSYLCLVLRFFFLRWFDCIVCYRMSDAVYDLPGTNKATFDVKQLRHQYYFF